MSSYTSRFEWSLCDIAKISEVSWPVVIRLICCIVHEAWYLYVWRVFDGNLSVDATYTGAYSLHLGQGMINTHVSLTPTFVLHI